MKLLSGHVIRDHALIGGLVALILLPAFGVWGSFMFWAANVLIDLDHYFRFLYCTKFKILGIGPMFRFHEKVFEQRNRPGFLVLELFHTAEFLLLVGVLSAFIPVLWPVFWGFLFHMLVDFIHLARFKMLTKRSYSIAEYFWRRRKLISTNRDPDLIFESALKASDFPNEA